jgi:hypothetical protein
MLDQEFSNSYDADMAERCRRALEKSYGADIPMPKCMTKKAAVQRVGFLGRKNVQK